MLDILRFIFSSFWVFAGTCILPGIAVRGAVIVMVCMVAIVRGGNVRL